MRRSLGSALAVLILLAAKAAADEETVPPPPRPRSVTITVTRPELPPPPEPMPITITVTRPELPPPPEPMPITITVTRPELPPPPEPMPVTVTITRPDLPPPPDPFPVTVTVTREDQTTQRVADAEAAIEDCRFEKAKELIEQLEDETTRLDLLRRCEAAERHEARTKELNQESKQLYRRAQEAENDGKEDLARDQYARALDLLRQARAHSRCERYLETIERNLRKVRTRLSNLTKKEEESSIVAEAIAAIDDCRFAKARELIDSLEDGPVKDDLLGRYERARQHESRSKDLNDEAKELYRQGQQSERDGDLDLARSRYARALRLLTQARDHTRCERYRERLAGNLGKLRGRLSSLEDSHRAADAEPSPQEAAEEGRETTGRSRSETERGEGARRFGEALGRSLGEALKRSAREASKERSEAPRTPPPTVRRPEGGKPSRRTEQTWTEGWAGVWSGSGSGLGIGSEGDRSGSTYETDLTISVREMTRAGGVLDVEQTSRRGRDFEVQNYSLSVDPGSPTVARGQWVEHRGKSSMEWGITLRLTGEERLEGKLEARVWDPEDAEAGTGRAYGHFTARRTSP
jgi:hypothetical protein